ncbi:MAG: Hsp70 family protein [Methanobrevibacter sp.]|jgi:molecular chaperone DnaK|nr:Hsp70 family protein [Methanobrevibacter sp.]
MVISDKEKVLGIDLGTSNSAAAVYNFDGTEIIPPKEKNIYGDVFPSYVTFLENEKILVGQPAKKRFLSDPKNTIINVKREMGTDHKIKIHNDEYTPQEISALILKKIKKDAENFLEGEEIKKAVITVPAYFNDLQRTATIDAGAIAGLDVIRLVNEPTAASLTYGFDSNSDEMVKIMVYDFGGGTLDITILNFENGVFDVKSTNGDTKLGGIDIDEKIRDYAIEEFEIENNINLRDDDVAVKRVIISAEKAKIELSDVSKTEIIVDNIAFVDENPVHLIVELTREKLEELIKPIVKKSEVPIKQALDDLNYTPSDIDELIIVGGTTRMPYVQKFVENYIGIPAVSEKKIDPMECVAKGAALQGAILEGEVEGLVLYDITPYSLGIGIVGNRMDKLIQKNAGIPLHVTKTFTTVCDYQEAVDTNVLQGENMKASKNKSIGGFSLGGITKAPAGVPQIDVSFDIDAHGIIRVKTQDQDNSVEGSITIKSHNKLSEEQIIELTKKIKSKELEN